MWKEVLWLVPPLLATTYALVAAIFLPSFRECPWPTHFPPLVPRVTCLAAVIAMCYGLPSEETWRGIDVILAVVLFIISGYYILQTRIHVVVGGPSPPLGDMKDKVVVITGANTGIGKETARLLLQQGATVVMACRSVGKARAAQAELEQSTPDSSTKGSIRVVALDLSKFDSVRQAAAEIKKSFPRIHVLINNAGVMMSQHTVTADGYEMVMQANHLGHFLWTRLLLPQLEDDGRILCLTSSTYSYAERMDLDDIFCTKGKRQFSLFGQYGT